jgi:hypothetical protein
VFALGWVEKVEVSRLFFFLMDLDLSPKSVWLADVHFFCFLVDTVMSRSPIEDNPTLSPMHINFDRDWGVKASHASRMEPPEVVTLLNNEPDIENVSEEQKEPTVVVNTKPMKKKKKIKPQNVKQRR